VPVIRNGIDLRCWTVGPGGGPAVWTGRLVPEKGAHLAIEAARRAGVRLLLAGPASDAAYLDRWIRPRLGAGARWLGHLDQAELVRLVGSASVTVVTPDWDEPFGLVVAESLASGTPVAGFARGALPEIVGSGCGVLAPPRDVDGLARAIRAAARLDRRATRAHAERWFDHRRMVSAYEALYRDLVREPAAWNGSGRTAPVRTAPGGAGLTQVAAS
jgi:glycosyltransferase involved in cell wall biosynthesis